MHGEKVASTNGGWTQPHLRSTAAARAAKDRHTASKARSWDGDLDGKAVAARECASEVRERDARRCGARGVAPGLATVLVGDDPASQIYVGSKQQGVRRGRHRARSAHELPASTSQAELLALVDELERRSQRARHSRPAAAADRASTRRRVIVAIPPEKDVDGLHPGEPGAAARGRAGAAALHAARRDAPRSTKTGVDAAGRARRGGRPQPPRRQAGRAAAARAARDRDDLPLAHGGSRRRGRPRRRPRRRDRQGRDDPRRLDPARRAS